MSENKNSTATNRKQSVINSETSGPTRALAKVPAAAPEKLQFVLGFPPLASLGSRSSLLPVVLLKQSLLLLRYFRTRCSVEKLMTTTN